MTSMCSQVGSHGGGWGWVVGGGGLEEQFHRSCGDPIQMMGCGMIGVECVEFSLQKLVQQE